MNRGRIWIAAVVVLLAGNAAAVLTLLAFAGDPTPRVEPDYYRRAVAWDQTMADRRASLALGWTVEVDVVELGLPAARLEIALSDDTGAPLLGAEVHATLRPRSRVDHPVAVVPGEQAGGRYLADVAITQPGLWVVEVEATRGDDRFLATLVVEPRGTR